MSVTNNMNTLMTFLICYINLQKDGTALFSENLKSNTRYSIIFKEMTFYPESSRQLCNKTK